MTTFPSSNGDSVAVGLIRRQEQMAAERSSLESQWQEIARFVNPMRAEFSALSGSPNRRKQNQVFDGTAGLAAEQLASGLWGMITNSANNWFALEAEDDDLNQDREIRQWLDHATRRMQAGFAANGGRFYSRVLDLYSDLVCFGTGVFYVEEALGQGGLHYSCRHLAECYIAENDREQVDTLIRKFALSARAASRLWGERCSPKIQKALEKTPDQKFLFLHAVIPRLQVASFRSDYESMAYASYYIDLEGKAVLAESGYHEFPYQVPRWSTRSRHAYGDSPAMLALSDIKMLNAMSKTIIVAAQKTVDPPLLAADEIAVRGLRTAPGDIIYGGIDANGRRLYEPLLTGSRLELGLEMEEQRRNAIREAFYFSLMLMTDGTPRTATEILARQEEKLRLMGPHLGRIQSEFLDPLIARQFAIMLRAGAFAPMPEALQAGPGLKVQYVSPLARAQKASEGNAILRTFEALMPVVGFDAEVLENFDLDLAARAVAEAYGLPPRLLRDPKAVAKLREEKAAAVLQQAALQQTLQTIPPPTSPPLTPSAASASEVSQAQTAIIPTLLKELTL